MAEIKKTKAGSIGSEHQRVGVFVDAQNMYHSAKNLYHAKVNFKKVLEAAVGKRRLIRAFIYVIRTETGEEKAFVEALEKGGFERKQLNTINQRLNVSGEKEKIESFFNRLRTKQQT